MPIQNDLDLSKTNECSGCGGPVARRRPSKSGTHWCKRVDCQRKRVAFYKKSAIEGAAEREKRRGDEYAEQLRVVLELLAAANADERVPCGACGADDAIVGFSHPSPAGNPCRALLSAENALVGLHKAAVVAAFPRINPNRKV